MEAPLRENNVTLGHGSCSLRVMGSWQVKLRNIRQPRLPVWQSKRKKTSSVLFVFSPDPLSLALGFRAPEFLLFLFCVLTPLDFFPSRLRILARPNFSFSLRVFAPPISLSSPFSFLFTPLGVPASLIFPIPPWSSPAPDFSLFPSCFRATRFPPLPLSPWSSRTPEISPFPLEFPYARLFPFPLGVLARPIVPFFLCVPARPTFPLSPWCSLAPDFLFLPLMFLHARFPLSPWFSRAPNSTNSMQVFYYSFKIFLTS